MSVSRSQKLATLLAALATAAFVAANAAHAFSIDPQSGTNADGSAKFFDPGDVLESFASGKNSTLLGNGFLNFDFRAALRQRPARPQVSPGYPRYRGFPDH